MPPPSTKKASPICICKSSARRTKAAQAARAGKLDTLWRIYAKHLKTPEAIEAMDELVSIVKSGQPVCLLCYERDKDCCHRSRIAEIVHERTGASVVDLVPRSCSERLFRRLRDLEVALDAAHQDAPRRRCR